MTLEKTLGARAGVPVDAGPLYAAKMRASALLVGVTFFAGAPDPSGIVLPPLDSPDWDAMERHTARQTRHLVCSTMVVLAVMLGLGWAIDLLVVHRDPLLQATFTRWRLLLLVAIACVYTTVRYWAPGARNPALTCAPFAALGCAGLGHFVSQLGGLERPYFYMMSGVLIIPAVAHVHLPARVVFLLMQAASMIAGFFWSRPLPTEGPLLAETLITFASLLSGSALLGHAMYAGVCHRFFQGLALQRAGLALEAYNRDLGRRVAEQTADLRRLAEHLQLVQEDERARLARELHDELGQRLSAMRYAVANAKNRISRDPATASENLAELDAMIGGALDCTSHIVSGLRPPLLDQVGLTAAIEWLARRMSEQANLRCALDLDEDEERCSPAISAATFRVLQESLTNVARHADATSVHVELRFSPQKLTLVVVDDGRGFSAEDAARPAERNGLLGMRERAMALGGELKTDNAARGGARVRLTLPLSPKGGVEDPKLSL